MIKKICQASTALIAALAMLLLLIPGQAAAQNFGGNVSFDWKINNTPAVGLTDISFHTTLNSATAHVAGNYAAHQYGFQNQGDVGYTGLQPRPDKNGKQRMLAIFSSFIAGTTSTDTGFCSDGADGGAGVSCKAEFDAVYGHEYTLTVARSGTDTWTGTAKDLSTGITTHIGTYKLPAGSGNLKSSQVGFIENYDTPSCATVPRIDVTIGQPTSSSGLVGTVGNPKEYGNCLGQANYQAGMVGNNLHITRGWA